MSNLPYKNPISPLQVLGSSSVSRTDTFGTNFSVLGTGGFMEVYNLSDLDYTVPTGQTGTIEFSGNTIPIQFKKGSGSVFSPDVLTLNSDNISSGRRRLGMLVYVYETKTIYQHTIDNYDNLWSAATAASGPGGATVVMSDFGTTVKNNTAAGQNFINAWTGSTIEGISGYTSSNATWRILQTGGGNSGDTFVTGFTYNNSQIILSQNRSDQYSGFTITLTGLTGTSTSGDYLPLSGGTVTGGTVFQSGLTANTISATTYFNLPVTADTFVTGFTFNASNYDLTIRQNNGQLDLTQSLSILASDLTVTGGTYNPNTGVATFTNNTGGTFQVSGFTSGLTDTVITNFTYTPSANTFTITDSRSSAFTATIQSMTGLTVNGIISATTISGETFYGDGSNLTNVKNIYNSDGTLISNRKVDMSSYTLTLSGRTVIEHFSTGFTDSPLIIRNTDPNAFVSNVISFDCDGVGVDQPVFMNFASTKPKGFGFFASSQQISVTPDGAGFLMYNNSSPNFPGQVFFDSGANDGAAIIFRTSPSSGVISERMRVSSAGNVGIGINDPKTLFHVLKGPQGSMGVNYYESAVVQNDGDTKLGVYTNTPSFAGGSSSLILGYSNLVDNDFFYPGFEFQHLGNSLPSQNVIRYNFVQRTAGGVVQAFAADLFSIFANGTVLLSATTINTSFISEPKLGVNVHPTNTLHISASTNPLRIEGLTADTSDSSILSIDTSGVVHTFPLSGITGSSVSGNFLPLSGGTVSGPTIFQNGLTANTISATTITATEYQNLPSQSGTGVSGFSYSPTTGILTITKNDTNTLTAGTFSYVTATTLSSLNVLSVNTNGGSPTTTTINAVTGGTYSNGTIILSGTGTIQSAITGFTKYFTTGSTPTGVVINSGDRWYNTNNGIELVYINDGNSSQWVQPANTPGPPGYSNLMITSGITTSAVTLSINTNYYGVNYNGNVNLTLPNPSGYDGYNMTIKDEGGYSSTYRIRLTPLSGLIDGNTYVDMNLNYIALHLVARNNNWWLI